MRVQGHPVLHGFKIMEQPHIQLSAVGNNRTTLSIMPKPVAQDWKLDLVTISAGFARAQHRNQDGQEFVDQVHAMLGIGPQLSRLLLRGNVSVKVDAQANTLIIEIDDMDLMLLPSHLLRPQAH